MKAYPSNFNKVDLSDVRKGDLLILQNGWSATVSNIVGSEIAARLPPIVGEYNLGHWFLDGTKVRRTFSWPPNLDVVRIERKT